MSIRVMTQGGGTGGASASIFVTGLSETDTVTAVKGSKTVRGKWVEKVTTTIQPLIPAMTSDTLPKGVVSASRYYDKNYPYQVFDGNDSTRWEIAYIQNANTNDYIMYTFDKPVSNITGFRLYGAKNVGGSEVLKVVFVYEDNSERDIATGITITEYNILDLTQDLAEVDTGKVKAVKIQATSFTSYNQISISEFQLYGYVDVTTSGHEITIKKYGMWSVTATNGEDTTTQDVLVDAAVEYEIEMFYRLYVIKDGEGFNCDLIYDPYKIATLPLGGSVELVNGVLKMSNRAGAFQTVVADVLVDFSKYSKIGFCGYENGSRLQGCCQTALSGDWSPSKDWLSSINLGTTALADYEYDISKIEGSYYVSLTIGEREVCSLGIKDLWLE